MLKSPSPSTPRNNQIVLRTISSDIKKTDLFGVGFFYFGGEEGIIACKALQIEDLRFCKNQIYPHLYPNFIGKTSEELAS